MRHKARDYVLLVLGLILIISLAACFGKPEPVLQWSKTFDGANGSVQQTTEGGYIVCKNTSPFSRSREGDIWLIKLDADGNKLWEKVFGDADDDYGSSVQQTTDGGYIVCGATSSVSPEKTGLLLVKTDAEGNTLWERTFSDERGTFGHSVQQTTDSGYILFGTSWSLGTNEDIWVIKTDADANRLWDKTFGGKNTDIGSSVQQTTDGGYIICGTRMFYDPDYDGIWLIKTDASGNKMWDITFGEGENDYGSSAEQTADGGYIVCGSKYSSGRIANPNIWIVKTDVDGNKLWDKTFGGKVWAEGSSAQQTQDGGYILCGTNYNNVWLIKTGADGNKIWDQTLDSKGQAGASSVQQR